MSTWLYMHAYKIIVSCIAIHMYIYLLWQMPLLVSEIIGYAFFFLYNFMIYNIAVTTNIIRTINNNIIAPPIIVVLILGEDVESLSS